MKYVLIVVTLILCGCSGLTNFQEQPVIELGNNTYKTSCNGLAEAFDSCNKKAKQTCINGYDLLEKTQLKDFVHREITFRCK